MKEDIYKIPYIKLFIFLVLIILLLIAILLIAKLGFILEYIVIFLKSIFLPFIIALVIAYLLNPLVTILNGNNRIPRSIAVLLIYIIFFGSITIILINAMPKLITEVKGLIEYFPNMFEKLNNWFVDLRNNSSNQLPGTFQESINLAINNIETKITKGFSDIILYIGNTINILITIVLVPFITFYLLVDYQVLEKTIITFVPKKERKKFIRIARDIDEALGNYIRGQLIVCLIIGILAYIGYLIIKLPYALVFAVIVAITNVIPYLGAYIGATPAILVGLSISWHMGASVFIVNMIIQLIESNVISPQIVGKKLHMHPLFIIIALMIGGKLAGIIGLIFAVPIFAILRVIAQHLSAYYLER
ncbi:MAG: AI-2E family transporter [Vulcanibacillus sp.]